jgi:HTH-type transcriptional regulator, sugar sensing transcriptional regulator
MEHSNRAELVELGLSPTEAQIYLALLQSASLSASGIATATGLSRTAVYQILCNLSDKGMIESGAGYGSKFAVIPPGRALPALIAREEEALAQRKKVAETLSQRLAALAESTEATDLPLDESIQVIRNPRTFAERHARLLLETNRTLEAFCKPPMVGQTGDRTLEKILRRGVRVRALYEPALLEIPAIRRDLTDWIAQGEEVRVYDGPLPHKLSIFDRKRVFVVLPMKGEQRRTLDVEHPEIAASFGITFETLWAQSKSVTVADLKEPAAEVISGRKRTGNGQASRSRK